MSTQYGIDFKDENKKVVSEKICASKTERDNLADSLLEDDNHPMWPETAVYVTPWQREILPVLGVDHGRGSVSRRFAGRTPRSAYQFKNRI